MQSKFIKFMALFLVALVICTVLTSAQSEALCDCTTGKRRHTRQCCDQVGGFTQNERCHATDTSSFVGCCQGLGLSGACAR